MEDLALGSGERGSGFGGVVLGFDHDCVIGTEVDYEGGLHVEGPFELAGPHERIVVADRVVESPDLPAAWESNPVRRG